MKRVAAGFLGASFGFDPEKSPVRLESPSMLSLVIGNPSIYLLQLEFNLETTRAFSL